MSARTTGIDGEALARFLRRRHPHGTAGYVATVTGIAEATIKDWLQLRTRPSVPHFMRLVEAPVYGAALIAACWPACPDFVTGAALEAEANDLRAAISAAERRLNEIARRAP